MNPEKLELYCKSKESDVTRTVEIANQFLEFLAVNNISATNDVGVKTDVEKISCFDRKTSFKNILFKKIRKTTSVLKKCYKIDTKTKIVTSETFLKAIVEYSKKEICNKNKKNDNRKR